MPASPASRSYSRYAREALTLLGQLIRTRRIERNQSAEDLASRIGVSRDMLYRMERGDPRCGIGPVFEAATIVGVPLFEEEPSRLAQRVAEQEEKLRLLPKAIHHPRTAVKDDF